NMTHLAEDPDGELYPVTLYLYKLVPAPVEGGAAPSFPSRLSATGCDPRTASGLVPYTVSSPLWSDGADKDRFIPLPDGKTIAVGADGDLDVAAGSVVVKTFSVDGKRIETRLLMRADDGTWAGYSYEWLDDQSDAVLLPASKSKSVEARTWSFPG